MKHLEFLSHSHSHTRRSTPLEVKFLGIDYYHRYTNNTPRSDIFFSGSPTLPALVLRLYTQV